jgi:hypothetical protein
MVSGSCIWPEPQRVQVALRRSVCLASIALSFGTPLNADAPTHLFSCSRKWSAPVQLTFGRTEAVVARWPSAAEFAGEWVITGTNAHSLDAPLTPKSLLLWSSKRGDLGSPRRESVKILPRVLVDRNGTTHLFWSEPSGTQNPTAGSALRLGQSLWWSSQTAASTWGKPEQLFEGAAITWSVASPIVRRDGISLAVLASARPQGGRPALFLFQFDGRSWRTRRIPGSDWALYPSIAEDRRGHLHVAFIAAARDTAPDANSVFLTSSNNDGASWSDPTLISRSGTTRAFDVTVLSSAISGLHLVWAQNLSGNLSAEAVRVVSSRNDGLTWSAPVDLAVPGGGFTSLRATADDCGVLHVMFEDWKGGGESGHIDFASFDGRWTALNHVKRDGAILDPILVRDQAGNPHAFAVEVVQAQQPQLRSLRFDLSRE